ncbi:LysR family transcriptional regulator [Comamonas antarctica]|uniref:LysR family transcriptional regulator n=1 Tax=Comamonas antarctica TaxID=2743470 RepID=A0A6N1X3V2_9BURK|nr:LysR family transcriptional regulator [Comamonas antarctica]QKV52953.1 LysR family transcriptional regulator [Comamonas antarctica]
MKLHQLRYLVALGAEGSIRASARSLGLAQATVTQGLSELQVSAGVVLLERRGRGVQLTPAGLELLEQARSIVGQVALAEQRLERHRESGAQRRLAVGVTPWVGQTLLAPVVSAFRKALPHVRLEFVDGFAALTYPRLRDGSLDLMIGRIAPAALLQGLQAEPLFRYEMTVVGRAQHPLAKARSLSELLETDWILSHSPHEDESVMQDLFGKHGLAPPHARIQLAHSGWLALALMKRIDMLSFWPWPLLETQNFNGDFVALNLNERFAHHEVGIVRRAQETASPPAALFIELFREQVRQAAVSTDPAWKRFFYTLDWLPGDS